MIKFIGRERAVRSPYNKLRVLVSKTKKAVEKKKEPRRGRRPHRGTARLLGAQVRRPLCLI